MNYELTKRAESNTKMASGLNYTWNCAWFGVTKDRRKE